LVVRRDWNFLGNAGRKHQGSFNLAEVLAAFLTKFQFRLTTKLDNQTHVR
jgi:NADH/NAD ratio-sensing transcriptional regulator Rex